MRALIVPAVLALAACATVTPYQPLKNGEGYSEQRIEATRYRVSFAGNDLTPRQTVENYLLYRAAELAVQEGYPYFALVSPSTEAQTSYTQTVNAFGTFGRYGWYPYNHLGTGIATSYPSTEYEAQAYVMLRKQRRGEDDGVFDAAEVKKNLEAQIQRPAPAAEGAPKD